MPRLIVSALLGCLCLLGATCPANSQVTPPLRPLVVRLDSGTTTKRPLVGIDTAAWRSMRVNAALDERQRAEQRVREQQWQDLHHHDSLSTVRVASELQATRHDNAELSAALLQQQARIKKVLALPLRPPWLVDSRFWTGTGIGAVAVVVLRVFVFR